MFKTLRFRFAAWVSILLLLALSLMGVLVYFSLSHSLANAVDDTLLLSASEANASINVENGQINLTEDGPFSVESTNLVQQGLTIRLLMTDGTILQAIGSYKTAPLESAVIEKVLMGQSIFQTVAGIQGGAGVRVYSEPILDNGMVIGILQMALSLKNTVDTLNRLVIILIVVIPIFVVFAGMGGYFIIRRALAPIDTITRTAKRISAKGLSERINLPATKDEVGRLAVTFDEMLGRLDSSFRRERQFTADVSHELRTPLTAMQTILNVIRGKHRSIKDYEQALADLAEETDRLHTLVENLLSLARSESEQRGAMERIDLSILLNDVTDSLRPLAEVKGVQLSCQTPPGLMLQGDRDGLIRLFVNLVDNAIRYTEKGFVKITASKKTEDTLQVSVKDTGIGIASEHLPNIFKRFYRVDPSRSAKGTGLGLAIALGIVRAHGGKIDVVSEVGKGTTFNVQLKVSGFPENTL